MPIDNAVLLAELTADELGRGYSGMADQQAADDLNTKYRTRVRNSLKGSEIFNAIDPDEFDALTSAKEQRVRDVWGLGDDIDIGPGTNARAVLLDAFGAGTATRDALIAVATESISRAEELGLIGLEVKHVRIART